MRLGLTSPMAIFSAHTASPPPPSRTPAGSRAPSRHASIAPRTTSARGPIAWEGHEIVLIDQSQLRQGQREVHASCQQSLTRLPLELLNGLPRSPRTNSAFQSTRSRVFDTTYFFAASIVRAKGSIQSGRAPVCAGDR